MNKRIWKYEVVLNQEERGFLESLTSKGKDSVRKIKRANILLLADEDKKDQEIAEIVKLSRGTVERIRKNFVIEGLEKSIEEKPRHGKPKKVDGRAEAEIITLACSNPPEGRAKWTLRLLADKVELNLSHVTVYNTLKKTKLSLG